MKAGIFQVNLVVLKTFAFLVLLLAFIVPGIAQDFPAPQRGLATFSVEKTGVTASGAVYNPRRLTCAHAHFPMGARLEVKRLDTGSTTQVIVEDRIRSHHQRVIDLSLAAAEELGMVRNGLAAVSIRTITLPFTDELNGTAAVIASRFHGRQTASGALYDERALVAGHASLPFGTRIRVTVRSTNQSVDVVVVDRTSKRSTHILNLSSTAARRLGMDPEGTAMVTLQVLEKKKSPKLAQVPTGLVPISLRH